MLSRVKTATTLFRPRSNFNQFFRSPARRAMLDRQLLGKSRMCGHVLLHPSTWYIQPKN